ncbi:hypothetical protein SLEP1_g11017 [Rubroshorea leprosula]|uniref:Uncharacterized protein n=1 Tax=Rubroshorea leprosula TaxID=152421 RepID=A0AAV5IFU4_9ROSI|nr:hypothetical protein SLEP1_g11017 [Rubroshorea leprosula]
MLESVRGVLPFRDESGNGGGGGGGGNGGDGIPSAVPCLTALPKCRWPDVKETVPTS